MPCFQKRTAYPHPISHYSFFSSRSLVVISFVVSCHVVPLPRSALSCGFSCLRGHRNLVEYNLRRGRQPRRPLRTSCHRRQWHLAVSINHCQSRCDPEHSFYEFKGHLLMTSLLTTHSSSMRSTPSQSQRRFTTMACSSTTQPGSMAPKAYLSGELKTLPAYPVLTNSAAEFLQVNHSTTLSQ